MVNFVAKLLLDYISNVVYDPAQAVLDMEKLPEEFQNFGEALVYFSNCVIETNAFSQAISSGCLDVKLPPKENEMASPLKSLHASLRLLTWQTQQIAKGDYRQRVDFMGDFSEAFNTMTQQLELQRSALLKEIENRQDIANYDMLTQLYNRRYCMEVMGKWLSEHRAFALCFVDIDNLKYVNDRFGHLQGDQYLVSVSKLLHKFSPKATICRIGGDEFAILLQNWSADAAQERLKVLQSQLFDINNAPDTCYKRSMSYGVIEVGPDNTMPICDLLSAADEKMYEYKRMNKKSGLSKVNQDKQELTRRLQAKFDQRGIPFDPAAADIFLEIMMDGAT